MALVSPGPSEVTAPRPENPTRAFLLRLHFYAGLFVGPFVLIAAISGGMYAASPTVERLVYSQELTVTPSDAPLPLGEQVGAARAYAAEHFPDARLSAVRPAPTPSDTTRVMFAHEDYPESQSRAVFLDPGTGAVRGSEMVYGSSGALPLRTWVSTLHRSLFLGDVGRLYSETAASWLWVVSLAGLGLWAASWRRRRTARRRELLRPVGGLSGRRRVLNWHGSVGLWVALGALFLSATGMTWSVNAGGTIATLRAALSWETPSLDTALPGSERPDGPAAAHHAEAPAGPVEPPAIDNAFFDEALRIGRGVTIDAAQVEIRVPADDSSAWVVEEIKRGLPSAADSVAIDGADGTVVAVSDFQDFPFMAKLTRWTVDAHMGQLFGVANQALLVALALGLAVMVVSGYLMWWKRRPTRRSGLGPLPRGPGRPDASAVPRAAVAALVLVSVAVGIALPAFGVTLLAFILVDAAREAAARRPFPAERIRH